MRQVVRAQIYGEAALPCRCLRWSPSCVARLSTGWLGGLGDRAVAGSLTAPQPGQFGFGVTPERSHYFLREA